MGQQQLLLLVLGIVIVGIAIVVGINAYAENNIKSNYDGLLQDALRIASDGQAWKGKPELFGGQDDSLKTSQTNFVGARFEALGYSASATGTSGLCYVNLNGTYTIAPTASELGIVGHSNQHQNQVSIDVTGTLEPDVNLVTAELWLGGQRVDGTAGAWSDGTDCAGASL